MLTVPGVCAVPSSRSDAASRRPMPSRPSCLPAFVPSSCFSLRHCGAVSPSSRSSYLRGETAVRALPSRKARVRPRVAVVVAAQDAAGGVPAPRRAGGRPASPLSFQWTRRIIFIGMSACYALYVALRATWTYVSPVAAQGLGLSLSQVGLIASAFPMMYGMSRLVTGVVADRVSPGRALGAGLLLAGLVNVSMSVFSGAVPLAVLWGLNGLVQGVGAGASAKLLTSWHSRTERGVAWSLWSSSANLGAFIAPIICGWLASSQFGFRAGLLIPGAAAVGFALLVTPLLYDSPSQAGLLAPWADNASKAETSDGSKEKPAATPAPVAPAKSFKQQLIDGVLKNKRVWALAASYFFVYFVRQGMRSWLHFFLVDARGCDAASAAYRVSGMEVGGIIGTGAAGFLSDRLDGRRVLVTIGFLVGLILALCLAAALPATGGAFLDVAAIALIGLFINGPQCLIGLIGAEVAEASVVATVSGVLGWVSYGGATASGYPLSFMLHKYGWSSYWAAMIVATAGALVLLLPMINLRGRSSQERSSAGGK